MEEWRTSLGPFGALENVIKVTMPAYSARLAQGFETISDILTVSQLVDSKPTATYNYHFTSDDGVGFSDKSVTVTATPAKIASLGGGISLPLGAVWFSTQGVVISLVGGPLSVGVAGFCAVVGEALTFKIADDALVIAFDPDQNYKELIYPETIDIPEIDQVPGNPMKDLVLTYEKVASHRMAFDRTLAKYYGALEAHDTEWVSKQLIAANYYFSLLKSDYLLLKPQTASALKYLKEDLKISMTEQNIEDAKEVIRTQGLPPEEVTIFKKFGYTDTDINAIKDLNLMVPNDQIINYDQTMVTNLENQLKTLDLVQADLQNNINAVKFTDAQVSIKPKKLNLNGNAKWIVAYIKIPGYTVKDIDISSISLNGVIPAYVDKKDAKYEKSKSKDRENDRSTLLVRFDRRKVMKIVEPGETVFTISGKVGDTQFIGTESVSIREHGRYDYREDENED
jgi:hypothetical protein